MRILLCYEESSKEVLKNITNNTLPGNHHFYITFDTNFKNVEIPSSLKKNHPEK